MRSRGVLAFLAGMVVGAGAYHVSFGGAQDATTAQVADGGQAAAPAQVAPIPARAGTEPSSTARVEAARTVDRMVPAAAAELPGDDGCEDDPSACAPDLDAIAARAEREWELKMIARALEADPMKNTGREVTEVERLEAYEAFAREPVDPVWRAEIEGRVQAGLETLAGIDYDVGLEFIDCRTDRCLARLPIPPDQDYMEAIEGLSGLLPMSGVMARQTVLGGERFVDVYLDNISLVEPMGERAKRLARQSGPD